MERTWQALTSSFYSRGSDSGDNINNYTLLPAIEASSPTLSYSSLNKDDTVTRTKLSLQRFCFFLLPSPIQRRLRPSLFKPQRLHPTSYLDGLRGVASVIVFFCHYTEGNLGVFIQTYGLYDEGDTIHSSPLQLPFLRVLYSGRPMVHIFFIISGFVLSIKSLKLARAHNYANLHTTLSSSVFRRALRLFIPTTISTFMVMIFLRLEWIGGGLPTLQEQIWDWMDALWRIFYSWNWDLNQHLPYDTHLWTIPIEMSNSMLLFVTITGLSRCKVWIRLVTTFGIMLYCLKCQHWAAFEFLGGMLIAEVGLIQIARAERAANKEAVTSEEPSYKYRAWQIFLIANAIIGLWLAGWPNYGADISPGFSYLYPITMDPYFTTGGDLHSFPWFALAAMQIVVAIHQIPTLQSIFNTNIVQYLANISYALYLMHGPMLDVFAHRLMPYVWWVVGGPEGMWSRTFGWFGGIIVLGIPTFWAADVFWRAVDTPSVEFAKWLEGVCIIKEE